MQRQLDLLRGMTTTVEMMTLDGRKTITGTLSVNYGPDYSVTTERFHSVYWSVWFTLGDIESIDPEKPLIVLKGCP